MMPIFEDVAESVSEEFKKRKLDAFEIFCISNDELNIEVKDEVVDLFNRKNSKGFAVRALRGKKMGFSSTRDLSSASIVKVVDQCVSTLDVVAESDWVEIPYPQDSMDYLEEPIGRGFSNISDDERMDKAIALEGVAKKFDKRISGTRSPCYFERMNHVFVMNSRGISCEASRGIVGCALQANASDGTDSESAYEFDFSNSFDELDVEATAIRASRRAVAKLGARHISPSDIAAVFSPASAASMLSILMPSFFADNVQCGRSMLADKLGIKKYSSSVNILDDGLMSGGFASFAFDGEGLVHFRTTVVDCGELASWLYDAGRAALDGKISTGNAVRENISDMPSIGVTNCYLQPGEVSFEELISKMNRGLFVTDLMGIHTANTVSGDFSLAVEGFFVENGKISYPVRGLIVAGNVHELFSRIVEVSNDLRFIGRYGSPSFLVESLSVSG